MPGHKYRGRVQFRIGVILIAVVVNRFFGLQQDFLTHPNNADFSIRWDRRFLIRLRIVQVLKGQPQIAQRVANILSRAQASELAAGLLHSNLARQTDGNFVFIAQFGIKRLRKRVFRT